VIEDAGRRLAQVLDDDAAEELEIESDQLYAEVVPDDQALVDAFERRYVEQPSDFAPLASEDGAIPEWMERTVQDVKRRLQREDSRDTHN